MLPKSNRLSPQEIPHVMRSGIRYQSERLTCVVLRGESDSPSRFAVTVSVKIDKRATARNRMKRLVREAIHDLLPEVASGIRGIFIIRGRLPDTERNVRAIVEDLLQRARVVENTKGDLR